MPTTSVICESVPGTAKTDELISSAAAAKTQSAATLDGHTASSEKIVPGSVVLKSDETTVKTWKDNADGTLTSDETTPDSGSTINYETGSIVVKSNANLTASATITAEYRVYVLADMPIKTNGVAPSSMRFRNETNTDCGLVVQSSEDGDNWQDEFHGGVKARAVKELGVVGNRIVRIASSQRGRLLGVNINAL